MSSNLPINNKIEEYIDKHSLKLHPVQEEIIKHNDKLGKQKKLQISSNPSKNTQKNRYQSIHLLEKETKGTERRMLS